MTSARAALVVLLAASAPYLIGLDDSAIWDSNEAFYVETPREMIERGDDLNPSFNYKPRFNKPPLCYWVVAASYRLFGVSVWAERVPLALGGLTIIATAFALGRLLAGAEGGALAATALAISPRFLMFARRIMIDIWIAMFLGLVLLFFALAEARPARRRRYLVLMYIAAGLGMLTKGPVAVVLPALAFAVYLTWRRELSRLGDLMLPAGLGIVGAIVAPWYAAIFAQHGWTHISSFFLTENLARYTDGFGPSRGPFFYLPVVFGDLFPSSLLLPVALVMAARWKADLKVGATNIIGQEPELSRSVAPGFSPARLDPRLLVSWVVVIVLFFSLSGTKQDLYVLPIAPAATALSAWAIVAAARRSDWVRSWSRALAALAGLITVALAVGIIYAMATFGARYPLRGAALCGWIALAGGVLATAAAVTRGVKPAAATLATTLVAFNWIFVLRVLPDFERYKPIPRFSEIIRKSAEPSARIGYYQYASPSMVFYLRRQVFEHYDERAVVAELRSGRQVFLVILRHDYERLEPEFGVRTYILDRSPVFDGRLRTLLGEHELPELLLVSNEPPRWHDVARTPIP